MKLRAVLIYILSISLFACSKEKARVEGVTQSTTSRITVAGLVKHGGIYEICNKDTFLDLLVKAGGEALLNNESIAGMPPAYVVIHYKNSSRETVWKRSWGDPVSQHAPLDNVSIVEFVAVW